MKAIVIRDYCDDPIMVEVITDQYVSIGIIERGETCGVALTRDQCAELIAAITEAAKELP